MVAPDASLLSGGQIVKRVFQEDVGAIRTVPAESTSFTVELSQADGDSVQNHPFGVAGTFNVLAATPLAEIIAPISAVGLKSAVLYARTNAALTTAAVATIQVSPEDSGSVWVSSGITVTSSTSNGVVVLGTSGSIVARRIRVVLTTAPDVDSVDIYLVAQAV